MSFAAFSYKLRAHDLARVEKQGSHVAKTHSCLDDLRAFMDALASPAFLAVEHSDGFRYAAFNAAHAAISGVNWAARSEIPLEGFTSKTNAGRLAARFRTCATSNKLCTYDETHETAAGRICWRISLSPLPSDERGRRQVLGVATDITREKLVASTTRELESRLSKALQVADMIEFLAIRTKLPLANVTRYIDDFIAGPSSGDAREALEVLRVAQSLCDGALETLDQSVRLGMSALNDEGGLDLPEPETPGTLAAGALSRRAAPGAAEAHAGFAEHSADFTTDFRKALSRDGE